MATYDQGKTCFPKQSLDAFSDGIIEWIVVKHTRYMKDGQKWLVFDFQLAMELVVSNAAAKVEFPLIWTYMQPS